MKLSQYKEMKNHRKLAFVIVAIIFLIGGIILDKTFASFKENKSFKVMEGNFIYEGSGDITLAFYQNNEQVSEIPKKENYYEYEKGECNNGASIEWDGYNRAPKIMNLTKSKTKCDLYFIKNTSKEYFENLTTTKTDVLIHDNTADNSIRFIGQNPNNYIDIGDKYMSDIYYGYGYSNPDPNAPYKEFYSESDCENSSYHYECTKMHSINEPRLWRIIGVMNNVQNEIGEVGSHIKIIRDSIGLYSWDKNYYNNGLGANEWSTSAIEKVLNENFYNQTDGGICYSNVSSVDCPTWSKEGLNDKARAVVSKVKWNTGASISGYTAQNFYNYERGNLSGKQCAKDSGRCSDTIKRTTEWLGYVGLMYPSDSHLESHKL